MTNTMVFSLALVAVLLALLGVLRLRHLSLQDLVFGVLGAITGLLLGALASVPLSKLPGAFGAVMPVAISITLTIIMIAILVARRRDVLAIMPFLQSSASTSSPTDEPVAEAPAGPAQLPQILVDTSAIIDGRIADIATAGFVPGRLAVPRFVLAELQNIADSDDAMRRGRGRRGLDVLNRLREMSDVEVTIIEDDAPEIREVDAKLVALAQRFGCNVLTTDYNLNRVAQIQGVRVLNVNELSNAIRPVVLPGEEMVVHVVQPGKERNQGVGYLADGTMIVVENGDKMIGQDVATEVTRVFQTVAGKMIFAVPRGHVPSTTHQPAAPQPSAPAPASAGPVSPSDAPAKPADQAAAHRGRFNRGRGKKAHNASPADNLEERLIQAANNARPGNNAQPDKPGKQPKA